MPAAGKGKEKEQRPRRKPGRVPTSCAECRRLKLRCDRNIPCEKCVSRGCGSICPDGALTPGKGNKMILANTEELHDRIDQLTSRNRELEKALQTLQSQVSDEPHPLLQKDTFQDLHLPPISSRPSTASSPDPPRTPVATSKVQSPSVCASASMDADPTTIANSSGTLATYADGRFSFFGSTARSEFLTYKPAEREIRPSRLSNELIDFACQDSRTLEEKLGNEIFSFRPQISEASRHCNSFFDSGKVMYSPVCQQELMDEILITVYHAKSFSDLRQPETLALLFMVFAISTHFDHSGHGAKHESSEYYYLARACLRLSVRRENTLIYLQTLIHMVQYLDFCGIESTPETQMELVGNAIRIGYKMGLHLHGIRWGLPDELAQRRARIFCELFLLDTWTSFNTGRPPTMSLAFMDRKTAKDYDEGIGADGNRKPGFHMWTYKYAILLHSVMAIAFGPKLPSYSSVLDLDVKVRNFPVPINWQPICDQEPPSHSPEISLMHFSVVFAKECTLLSLHRSYFIQALEERPEDLSKHRFIPSVLAIYRSAWRLMRGLRFTWTSVPRLLSKVTTAWSQALSAAIVMCLFVVKAPGSHLTDPALDELGLVIELFEEAAPTCRAANDLLGNLRSLRRLARASAGRAYEDEGYALSPTDLDRLAGKTKYLPLPGSGSPTSISFALGSSGAPQHSEHSGPHPGLSAKDPPPSRSTSVTLSDMPANSPFAPTIPLPLTSSLHTSSAPSFSPTHPLSHHVYHSHMQSHPHRHHPSHSHLHSHASHTHTQHPPHIVQMPPQPQPTAIPAPTHALHPTILQDFRDFNMRGRPANSSPMHYFDFPPEEDISMTSTNVGSGRSSSSGGPNHGARYQFHTQGHSHEQHDSDYSFYQSLESSFQLEYAPQPRSPFSAVNFDAGMSGAGVPVLDAAYHQLVEHLGFHS